MLVDRLDSAMCAMEIAYAKYMVNFRQDAATVEAYRSVYRRSQTRYKFILAMYRRHCLSIPPYGGR